MRRSRREIMGKSTADGRACLQCCGRNSTTPTEGILGKDAASCLTPAEEHERSSQFPQASLEEHKGTLREIMEGNMGYVVKRLWFPNSMFRKMKSDNEPNIGQCQVTR